MNPADIVLPLPEVDIYAVHGPFPRIQFIRMTTFPIHGIIMPQRSHRHPQYVGRRDWERDWLVSRA